MTQVAQFSENKFFIPIEDMVYIIGSTTDKIDVPKGLSYGL